MLTIRENMASFWCFRVIVGVLF